MQMTNGNRLIRGVITQAAGDARWCGRRQVILLVVRRRFLGELLFLSAWCTPRLRLWSSPCSSSGRVDGLLWSTCCCTSASGGVQLIQRRRCVLPCGAVPGGRVRRSRYFRSSACCRAVAVELFTPAPAVLLPQSRGCAHCSHGGAVVRARRSRVGGCAALRLRPNTFRPSWRRNAAVEVTSPPCQPRTGAPRVSLPTPVVTGEGGLGRSPPGLKGPCQ